MHFRNSRLIASAIVLLFLSASTACRADNLLRDAKALRAGYAAKLEKLAVWCEEQGLATEAKTTRAALGRETPYKLCLPALPREVGPPKLAANTPAAAAEWQARLLKMRCQQAAAMFDLARRAIRQRQASLAYHLLLQAVRCDPDNEDARRVLGYQKYLDQWCTAYEGHKLRAGMVWSDKFGWLTKEKLSRYEAGERLSAGRWISAAEDARLHRNIQSGWRVETEHYLIRTNHGIEAAVGLGLKLETLYRLWQQVFVRFYASEAYIQGLFGEGGQARRSDPPRFDVVYFRDRDEYVRTLRADQPRIDMTRGLYLPEKHAAYFYAGGEDTERVLYHEATHQLFQQSRRASPQLGQSANFWIVEGIATFMESLHQEGGDYVLGGLGDVRMDSARYHFQDENYYVPFGRLVEMGKTKMQAHAKLAKLYSQVAAMTSFLMFADGGRYRDALVGYLSAVYNGSQDTGLLARLTGAAYTELDEQYKQYLTLPP